MTVASLVAALLSTGFISVAPNLLLILFPSFAEDTNSVWLLWGQALAAGGLLGDVFLHSLGHDVAEDAGVWILFGFVVFLVLDLVIQSLEGSVGSDRAHSHSHPHQTATKTSSTSENKPSLLSSAVLLNLTADALHNFTDGLAIGASYAAAPPADVASMLSSSGGLVATISILLHEIPHELGDYAILIQHGFTKWQAITAQFGTAIAAMTGAVMGVYAVQLHETAVAYATAGGFLYLAVVSILPNVMATVASDNSGKASNVVFRKASVVVAFCAGIAFLYAVHSLEDHDHHGGGHSHAHHHHHHSSIEQSDTAGHHNHHEPDHEPARVQEHSHHDGHDHSHHVEKERDHDHHHDHHHEHNHRHEPHHHDELAHDHENHHHEDHGYKHENDHHHEHHSHQHSHGADHHHDDHGHNHEKEHHHEQHSHEHSHGATDEL